MNDDAQRSDKTPGHPHGGGRPARAGAPPLRLAGADDDAAVTAEPHIVRGID
ncbi:hypothetical protein [Streptomyces longispororuber]|uniref:hypothetical protein n=1 Tax=Streptomyces longispororuber TaxID=68230 RepID=UPI00210A446C|nr:hypothetical protein [Streptomyces longispororuber]MCQ4208846.1 hypothetical protein [Streptomyces longispororuber]